MLVLPEPVGPVTSRIPSGEESKRSNVFWSSLRNPSSGRPSIRVDLSRTRITMLSPWLVGIVETRRSIGFCAILTWMRPSCGRRFSAMLIEPVMIFRRLMIADCNPFGRACTS